MNICQILYNSHPSITQRTEAGHPEVSKQLVRKETFNAKRYIVLIMIKNFKCRHTQALYEGKSPKQFKSFQAQAERKLQMLDSAAELLDLRSPAGNKLKKLGGDRQGQHSIRINNQWRVCFVWSGEPNDVEIADYH